MRLGTVMAGVLFAVLSTSVHATSIIPPLNLGELVLQSENVVWAQAQEAEVVERRGLFYTQTTFVILESVDRGSLEAGDTVRVEAPGGRRGERSTFVAASPRFAEGDNYLLCLHRKNEELWITTTLSYGVLRESLTKSGDVILSPVPEVREASLLDRPDGEGFEPVGSYRLRAVLDHLRDLCSGRTEWDSTRAGRFLEEIRRPKSVDHGDGGSKGVPAGCEFFEEDGAYWRWRIFDNNRTLTVFANEEGDPSEAEQGFRRIQEGLDKWLDVEGTRLNLLFGGARNIDPSCGGTPDFVLFNDPCNDIADISSCGGTLALGGGIQEGFHFFEGSRWATMQGWFVILNEGVGCLGKEGYRRLLAHELGHGLGFGHPSDQNALMFQTCCRDMSALDRSCARAAYPELRAGNMRPQVDVGPDRMLTLPSLSGDDRILLTGVVEDDGLPVGRKLTARWIHLVGPGTVAFGSATELETTVLFSHSGSHLLGLIVDDGELVRMDQVLIEVMFSSVTPKMFVFEQGVEGYAGTIDTTLDQESPNSDFSSGSSLKVDGDGPNNSSHAKQVLLRFSDIFGLNPGQIPPESLISSAWLELLTTNRGSGADLHRMLYEWDDSDTWNSFSGNSSGGLEASFHTVENADVSVFDASFGLTRIEVTKSLMEWSLDPESNYGWAFLPVGNNRWNFSSSDGGDPPRLVVGIGHQENVPLISIGDVWLYRKGLSEPPVGWREVDFSPGGEWLSGPSGIGYNDDDDVTILTDMEDSYPSIVCRREFLSDGLETALRLRVDYDDAYVAYLNGVEISRSSNLEVAGSPVPWNFLVGSGREAGHFEETLVAPDLLRVGRNVLAVAVHNKSLGSNDLSFIPELIATLPSTPVAPVVRFRRGDVSSDGTYGIEDPMNLLFYVFGGQTIDCLDAGDVDDNSVLDLTDAVRLLTYLYLTGVAPAAPGTSCGEDVTVDTFGPCLNGGCP